MRGTVDCWLERVARRADEDPDSSLAPFSAELWFAVRDAYREIPNEALKVCGSCPFAVGEALDQDRRALYFFYSATVQSAHSPAQMSAWRLS